MFSLCISPQGFLECLEISQAQFMHSVGQDSPLHCDNETKARRGTQLGLTRQGWGVSALAWDILNCHSCSLWITWKTTPPLLPPLPCFLHTCWYTCLCIRENRITISLINLRARLQSRFLVSHRSPINQCLKQNRKNKIKKRQWGPPQKDNVNA